MMKGKLGVICAALALSSAAGADAQPPSAANAPPGASVLLATSETAPVPKPSAAPLRTAAVKASEKAERAAALKAATHQLESSDAGAIETAFDALAKLGGRDAAEPVIARLRRGLPPQLIDVAVESLVTLKQPSAVPVLLELTTHRRWQVRERALDALGALSAKSAQSALLYALDDPSPEVREASARALAKVGDGRASAALLTAHERGVRGALVALGGIGGQREAELLGKRAQTECAAVTPALLAMLQRPRLFAAVKLRAVAVLASARTAESTACLAGLLSSLGADTDPRLRSVIAKAAGAPATAPGAAPAPAAAPARAAAPAVPAPASMPVQGGKP